MNPSLLSLCLVLTALTTAAQTWPGIKDSLFSKSLNEQRTLQVILPGDYKPGSAEKYETVYMLDGEWYLEQVPFIYKFTVAAGFTPKAVFVLIPNKYINGVNLRDRDYSPTPEDNDPNLGHADQYHAFLKNEVIPYIESKYPVNGEKILVGSSFSGLFSVYAFIKDPELFNGYVASDPNLNWDDYYVSKLAKKMLTTHPGLNQSLYIAGLDRSYRDNGIDRMDSVFKTSAPSGLQWKVQLYENETHYSVQHKAFYEGFRFMHLGYTKDEPEFHPKHGTIVPGSPVQGYFLSANPAWHYTVDGSEPNLSSPVVVVGAVPLTGPSTIRVKSFTQRATYKKELSLTLGAGKALEPPKTKKPLTAGFTFLHYMGSWMQIPDTYKLKPASTQPFDGDLKKMNDFKGAPNSLYVINGVLEVPEDAYYVFAVELADAARISVDNEVLYEQLEVKKTLQSVGVNLKKGLHPVRAELLRKKGTSEVEYLVFRSTASNPRWWQNIVR